MKKFQKYIKKGVVEPLETVSFHGKAPINRLLMLDKKRVPDANVRVAVHFVTDVPKNVPAYCELHKHDCDEINLILSEDGALVYKVQLEDEVYEVTSPATIFIPKGIRHSAEVISGKGMFVCILLEGEYNASK